MESALFNLLSSAIPALLSKSSSSTNEPHAPSETVLPAAVPLPGAVNTVVPPPASASSTTSIPRPPSKPPSRSDLIRSFQWNCYDLTGTETGTTSVDIFAHKIIQNLCTPFTYAVCVELSVTLMPTHNSIKYPVTTEVLWAPANSNVSGHEMNTYGATRLVAGSVTDPSNHLTVPCDLSTVNTWACAPIAFINNPKLYLKFYMNDDSYAKGVKAPISASLFISGKLSLTHPTTTATY